MQLVLIVSVASCAAIFGVIFYIKLHNESGIDSTSVLSEFTDVPSVRTPNDGDRLQTLYHRLHPTEKNEWYPTTSEYDETDDPFASTTTDDQSEWFYPNRFTTTESTKDVTKENDFSSFTTTPEYEMHIFGHKHHTTTEATESEEDDHNWSTSTMQSETIHTTKPSESYNGWGIPTTTAENKTEDYNNPYENLIDYNEDSSNDDSHDDYNNDDDSNGYY